MRHHIPSYVAYLITLLGVFEGLHAQGDSTPVRLVGGNSDDTGLVQLFVNGEWVFVNGPYVGYNEAKVICRMLGYNASYVKYFNHGNALFGTYAASVLSNRIHCNGDETDIKLCTDISSGWKTEALSTHTDGSVSCDRTQLRLMDGDSTYSGRVEYLFKGRWHSICGSIDNGDAKVICNSLGFSTSGIAQAFSSSHYGQGSGDAVITSLACIGTENDIKFCSANWYLHQSCNHILDAGVTCGATQIRLVNGPTNTSGRVEVYHGGKWGTICGYGGFSSLDAKIVCGMLGIHTTNAIAYPFAYYGEGNNHIMTSQLVCDGSESDIINCRSQSWQVSGRPDSHCSHYSDVGVNCDGVTTIRLADGISPHSGRVEVFHNGHWGTMDDTGFDNHDLAVICRMLGYEYSSRSFYMSRSYYGHGMGDIVVSNLQCDGSETDIGHCPARWWPSTSGNDAHTHDIGVSCDGLIPIKLVGGDNSTGSGRVELLHNGMYGTICSRRFDSLDLSVVCRMLGYESIPKTAYWRRPASYSQGLGEVIVSDLACNGFEDNIGQCGGYWPAHSCDHGDDLYVNCRGDSEQLRLVDGNNQYSGRVEIFHDGRWSTICDDEFDRADAVVICRILKFQNPERAVAYSRAHFGTVNDTVAIVLKNLGCNGLESNLGQCSPFWTLPGSCQHSEDIGVDCCPGCQPQVIVG